MRLLLAGLQRLSVRAASSTTAMGKNAAYAVVTGRKPGLYRTWEQCQAQVNGYPGCRFKGFKTEQEALRYLSDHGVAVEGARHAAGAAAGAGAAAAAAAAARRGGGTPSAAAAAAAAAPAAAAAAAPARGRKRGAAEAPRRQAAVAPRPVSVAAGGAHPPTGRVFRLEFDGASKQNPGPAGFGAVLFDDATGAEVARMCQYMGKNHTNNQAEYAGLIAGLLGALELGCQSIKVQGDSTLIIRQVLGEWQVKNDGLKPYHAAATELKRRFARFEARQVPREHNKVADALSNQAIDDWRSGANRHEWKLGAAMAAAEAAAEAADEEDWAGGAAADPGGSSEEGQGQAKRSRVDG